ncbi:hypothetical protein ACXU4B_17140 [Dyella soli]|uniref:DUF2182 domain-containing protein n=1 Tax=Dyella soli TaxID=522319 RepID=A0A4R0YLW7_9GAMM|nr:hypothetical protein [Dyella soli]TCI06613.1 hypothetical protein EZM97_33880 [Dyella soli]
MRAPVGSVVGLCSASATLCAVDMAFLGYWGLHEAGPWQWNDRLVVALGFIGFAVLAATPWIATTPVPDESADRVPVARRTFALGVSLIWLAAMFTLF